MTAAALLNSEPGGAGAGNPPMSREAAENLDRRIRLIGGDAKGKLDKLAALLDQAMAGAMHCVLGFDSWTAYLADGLAPLRCGQDIEACRELVALPVLRRRHGVAGDRSSHWREPIHDQPRPIGDARCIT